MANPKQDIQKQADPLYEESKTQASSSEGTKTQSATIEELKKQAAAYEALKKQVDSYEELKKQVSLDEFKKQSTSYPEEMPYSSQLRTLRERVNMLASSPNSDVNEIAQCIKAITFFENQQARELAERRIETQKTSLFFDNQSILQTNSVRKKDPNVIDTTIREPEFQKKRKSSNNKPQTYTIMDVMNNLLFTARNTTYEPPKASEAPNAFKVFGPVNPDYINILSELPSPLTPIDRGSYFSYNIESIQEFCAVDDSAFIENAIQKHWADIVNGRSYVNQQPQNPPLPGDPTVYFSRFRTVPPAGLRLDVTNLIPPYHLIYAYLVENTRCTQIFEKLLFMYMHDEKLNKATTAQIHNRLAFQWMVNTENLFYKYLPNTSYRNITSDIRQNADATRRHAYYRMFGMDLAFGDAVSNSPVSYYKAEYNNQPFILLFEKFLTEIWQAYTNASNTSGANTTDMFVIVDTAQKIQEMLMSRRTTETTFDNYRYFNLSREEVASVVMMSWLYEVVSYDSPIVNFLRCNGNTPGERLINIGNRVGLPAHSKSEGLLDIAPPMNTLLRRIELGDYSPKNEAAVSIIIKSQKDNLPQTDPSRQALNDLLLIINNWEKATGHKIKNPEANVTGTVKVQQNGSTLKPVMN